MGRTTKSPTAYEPERLIDDLDNVSECDSVASSFGSETVGAERSLHFNDFVEFIAFKGYDWFTGAASWSGTRLW